MMRPAFASIDGRIQHGCAGRAVSEDAPLAPGAGSPERLSRQPRPIEQRSLAVFQAPVMIKKPTSTRGRATRQPTGGGLLRPESRSNADTASGRRQSPSRRLEAVRDLERRFYDATTRRMEGEGRWQYVRTGETFDVSRRPLSRNRRRGHFRLLVRRDARPWLSHALHGSPASHPKMSPVEPSFQVPNSL